MSLDDVRNVAALGSSLLAIGTAIYAWLTSRSRINAGEIRDLQNDMAQTKVKLASLEQTLAQMPNKDAVHQLDLKVSQLNGSIGVLAESLKAVQVTASRIEAFLLDQGKK